MKLNLIRKDYNGLKLILKISESKTSELQLIATILHNDFENKNQRPSLKNKCVNLETNVAKLKFEYVDKYDIKNDRKELYYSKIILFKESVPLKELINKSCHAYDYCYVLQLK